eukprot:3050685-Ditylum_brightwellii.AAC.1
MQYVQESDAPLTSIIPTASTPIINHLNQFSQGQQCCTPEQTNDYHCAKIQKKASQPILCSTTVKTTSQPCLVGKMDDSSRPAWRNRGSIVCSNRTNISNKFNQA